MAALSMPKKLGDRRRKDAKHNALISDLHRRIMNENFSMISPTHQMPHELTIHDIYLNCSHFDSSAIIGSVAFRSLARTLNFEVSNKKNDKPVLFITTKKYATYEGLLIRYTPKLTSATRGSASGSSHLFATNAVGAVQHDNVDGYLKLYKNIIVLLLCINFESSSTPYFVVFDKTLKFYTYLTRLRETGNPIYDVLTVATASPKRILVL